MNPGIVIPVRGAILRPWSENDIPALARVANNPRIASMMRDGFPSPYSPQDARQFIELATGPTFGLLFAIEVEGSIAGGIGIHPLADVYRKTAEIGYWVAEPFWGRGIATAAVGALVPVAFTHYELLRLQAGVFSTNPASMRVLEKNGFMREAVHQKAIVKNTTVLDEVLYVRFKKEEIGDQTGTTRLP